MFAGILDRMQGTGDRWVLRHVPALDGVRGIAVLLVFIGHLAVLPVWGLGAVGVSVFFTLSGFLITGLLLEEHTAMGRIRLRRFYERRARRLLPALLASTATVAMVGPVVGSWWFEWNDVPGVLLYYSNWAAMDHGGLDSLGAFSGTWSLSIEEQFYLVWPLALLVVIRAGRRAVLLFSLLGLVLSLALRANLMLAGASLDRVYLGTDMVATALLAGAALVAWQGMRPPLRHGQWLALVGVLVVLVTTGLPPGFAVLFGLPLATVGSVLLLAGTCSVHPVAPLQSPVLMWLGQRSYGLYVWHIPLAALLRGAAWASPAFVAVMLPASLGMAELSYRCIEQPFRHRSARRTDHRHPGDVRVGTAEEPGPPAGSLRAGRPSLGVKPERAALPHR